MAKLRQPRAATGPSKQLTALLKLSPTAMAITLEQLKRCANRSFEDSMTIEYRMSQGAMRPDHDFFEGVRALLIDKDQKPKWNPPTIEGVTPAMVEAHFKPVSNCDLFLELLTSTHSVIERSGFSFAMSTLSDPRER